MLEVKNHVTGLVGANNAVKTRKELQRERKAVEKERERVRKEARKAKSGKIEYLFIRGVRYE